MIAPRLAFFFCATVCFSRYFSPSVKENENKKFIQQGGYLDTNHTFTPLDFSYLTHQYYTISYNPMRYWGDIQFTGNYSHTSEQDDSPPNEIVNTFKEAGWRFPFYGHYHDKIYIDPNGFVSVVDRKCVSSGFCNWQTGNDATYKRYIAPLMTDFNPKGFKFSKVYFVVSSSEMIIQWQDVTLYRDNDYEGEVSREKDGFTFQVILKENGKMIFNYRKLPYFPGNQSIRVGRKEMIYPVVMGVEDASVVEDVLVPYLPINLNWEKIFNEFQDAPLGVSVELVPHRQCIEQESCYDCVEFSKNLELRMGEGKCGWCAGANVCSDLIGRQADALSASCIRNNAALSTKAQCDKLNESTSNGSLIAIIVIVCSIVLIVVGCGLFKWHSSSKKSAPYKKGATVPTSDKGSVNTI